MLQSCGCILELQVSLQLAPTSSAPKGAHTDPSRLPHLPHPLHLIFHITTASADSDKQIWGRPGVPKMDVNRESLSKSFRLQPLVPLLGGSEVERKAKLTTIHSNSLPTD